MEHKHTSTMFDDGFGNDHVEHVIAQGAWIGTFEKVIWFLFGVTLDQGFPIEFMRSTPGDTVTLRPAGKEA